MSYFAELKDNKVQRVIVASQEFINSGAVGDPKNWVETKEDNYAGIGHDFDGTSFIPPKPNPSWKLVGTKWEAPTKMPTLFADKISVWDEKTTSWKSLTIETL